MRVAYIGNYRHPFCTEVHVAADIEALGHQVARIQEQPGTDRREVRNIERVVTAARPDLVLFTRTWGLHESATEMWRRFEQAGIVTASYHLDKYVGLAREDGVKDDPFWTTQFVATPDGDPASDAWFAERGINHIWSPPAVVSSALDMVGTWRPEFDYDVVFVGSYGYHPEHPWRTELIDWLAASYGPKFRRFSGDQPEGPIREQPLVDLYATARVAVGDSLVLPGTSRYTSDRLFETLGRGGVLLYPDFRGIEELGFEDGKHLRLYEFGDFDAIGDIIDELVAFPEQARRMAERGRELVRERHTYAIRLAAFFQKIGLG